jgi:hypothetical protein
VTGLNISACLALSLAGNNVSELITPNLIRVAIHIITSVAYSNNTSPLLIGVVAHHDRSNTRRKPKPFKIYESSAEGQYIPFQLPLTISNIILDVFALLCSQQGMRQS